MSTEQFILSLDQGTSSCRSVLIDSTGKSIAQAQQILTQHYPKPGYVEHDADEIWNIQFQTIADVISKCDISPYQIKAIGITNQRETIVLWDQKTGKPLAKAIVWQDNRTKVRCKELVDTGHSNLVQNATGLVIDSYFSATKIEWLLNNNARCKDALDTGTLRAGTIDTWLIYKLTEGREYATDPSNASRTMLFDIHKLEWSGELCDLFGIPVAVLPEVRPSNGDFGSFLYHGAEIPIRAVLGDQQAALFGQLAWDEGQVKNTYGTGCFTLLNTGETAVQSSNKLLTTVAWQMASKPAVYAIEGSVFHAGSAIQWLRDGLGLIEDSSQTEELSKEAGEEQNVIMVPAFSGLGAPYWDMNTEASFFGITLDTKPRHMVKATLDALAYQTYDLLQAMEADSGSKILELRADGGAAANNYLMQFQADLLQTTIARNSNIELTAMGVGYMAGLAVNMFSEADLQSAQQEVDRFPPKKSEEWRRHKLRFWHRAVNRTLNWLGDDE